MFDLPLLHDKYVHCGDMLCVGERLHKVLTMIMVDDGVEVVTGGVDRR